MSETGTAPEEGEEDATAASIFRVREDGSRLHRALVLLAPLGLALDIVLSLWVSYLHVSQSAIVQIEQQWVAEERLAVRAQLLDVRDGAVDGTQATLTLRHEGREHALGQLEALDGGLTQGFVRVPALAPGPAQLEVELGAPGREPMRETIPIEVVGARPQRSGEHTISTSMLQWADDTDPQPESLRIDLRPFGRILAGFDNEFLARVTDPEGKPWVGPVEIVLVHGEFAGEVGSEETPPVLYEGNTDALGLVSVGGLLTADVVRIEVRVHEPAGEDGVVKPPLQRRFRYVSYPGGVRVESSALAAKPGDTLEILAHSLRKNRPVFVDLHDPAGAWIDTLMPPFTPGEPAREWSLPATIDEGFVQIEAYHYTNDPGEGTALARVYVGPEDPRGAASLEPLIERQRELLDLPRLDKEFDTERERKYLDRLAAATLAADEVSKARHWLIGSLPVEVHGPPTALMTQVRDEDALLAKKKRWTVGLRWFLWGGGALFIVVFALSVVYADREAARRMSRVLDQGDAESAADAAQGLMTARRSMLFRAGIVVGIMVATLILAVMLLENLVWVA